MVGGSPLLGRVIAQALTQLGGVGDVVICPGSRSTAVAIGLAEAAQATGLRLHTRTDERAGAFLALGLAKARGIAAIVVTSGTALGNLMPAIMEARHSGVPLVVVTADRPATQIGTGTNQTTDQIGIFGRHVVDQLHLASTDDAPQAWFGQLARVLAAARGLRTRTPGPVQVNAAFTEPFTSTAGRAVPQPALARIEAARPADPVRLPAGPRTVVLAGDAPPAVGRRARAVAEAASVPLLAEPSSNARAGRCAMRNYRLLLDGELGQQIERVVCFGHPTLSRPISRLLARPDIELVMVSQLADWPDPGARAAVVCDDVDLAPGHPDWLAAWHAAAMQSPHPGGPDDLITGPQLAAEVVAAARGNLVFGASNPIRDADLAAIPQESDTACWANRGLAGIDGVLATATGIVLGSQQPGTVLLGDLGFLHDIGSLHIPAGQPVPDLRVVVADDDGGGIFRTLEVAGNQWFEPLFAMPHGRDLVGLAAGFGWPASRVSRIDELRARLARPISGIEVLVVPIDPNRQPAR